MSQLAETSSQRSQFLMMALTMSWQLAVAVLVPVLVGVWLDNIAGTSPLYVIAGLLIAFVLAALVMWRTLRLANGLPVPKLTDAQKKAIQKQYEEDDADA
jgi:F0F1-type ATP synthase assembly protein I